MNRRQLLQSAAAVPIAAALPWSAAPGAEATFRWYAVGNGEMAYPYWAESRKAAARLYARDWARTLGDDCPECGAIECLEHLTPEAFDEPTGEIEVDAPPNWATIGPDRHPSDIDWMTAGYNVPCAWCADEPTECEIFAGEPLCCECLELARGEAIDQITGAGPFRCTCKPTREIRP